MNPSTRITTIIFSCFVVLFVSGCAHDLAGPKNHPPLPASDTGTEIPTFFLKTSNDVKQAFHYDNRQKPTWPPRRDLFGHAIGNCMTYSRLIHQNLRASGYSVRYRNVLGPQAPREHVVAVATDNSGEDWVFDNRHSRPYPLWVLAKYYELESFHQNAQVGAQRYRWATIQRQTAYSLK